MLLRIRYILHLLTASFRHKKSAPLIANVIILCLLVSVNTSFANDYEFKILSPFTGNLDCTWKESSIQTLVDDSMWLVDPVEDSYDPTGGLPADPTVGDRYISDATANGWTIDYIYEWDGTSWEESIPEEGWMVWMLLDLLYYVFFSGGWMEVGSGTYLSLDGESIDVTNGTFDLTTTGDISVGKLTYTSLDPAIPTPTLDLVLTAGDTSASNNLTLTNGTLTADTLTDGTATLTGGVLSGATALDTTLYFNNTLKHVGVGVSPTSALDIKAVAYTPGVTNTYNGNGLNDMTLGGGYTGSGEPSFTVVIDGVNTVKTSTLGTSGADYAEDDTFTINNGTILATGTVLTVNAGAVVTYSLSFNGSGYWVANDFGTVATSGSGTGLEINVTALVDTFKWKKDAGAYTENVEITGAAQELQEGVEVTFAAIVGHNSISNFTLAHTTTDGVAPVNKTITYGVVATAIGGTGTKYWITQNLGATNQATSAIDSTEPSAGWYWQFNRKQGFKHDGTTRTPSSTWITPIEENISVWDPAKDPCTLLLGSGWRLPTKDEWTNADGAPQNWANRDDTYASVLKLHAAGRLYHSNGALDSRGSYGYYWSSTQHSSTNGYHLYFHSSYSGGHNNNKAYGFGVRGLRDDAPVADQWVLANLTTVFYDTVIFRDYTGRVQASITKAGELQINGTSLFLDKAIFTQTDGNEYIDSLNDGYLDIGATTGIRLLTDTVVTGSVDASTGFKDNGTAGIDTTFVDADGNTITVSGGIIVSKVAP